MRKKTILIAIFIAIFFEILYIGKYILFDYSYFPKNSKTIYDLDKIKTLSNSHLPLPLSINYIFTGKGELLKWTIAAGDNSVPNHYTQTSFQIVYDNASIIIDTPMNEEQFKKFNYGKFFFKNNYFILQEALKKSNLIIFTHEHWDHTGGLAKSPNLNLLINKTILTEEQINSPLIKKADFPAGILNKIEPLCYKKYYQIAPGIVLIKAPGHTPGHQMIYVKLQNGNEFLFIGDIAWNFVNIEKKYARPLIVNILGGENPKQIGNQIQWLSNIHKNEKIYIVPSHDIENIKKFTDEGILNNNYK